MARLTQQQDRSTDAGPAVVIGDVGGAEGFHAGDEAMLEAIVAASGRRDWIAVSRDPPVTAARLGVEAVAGLGFDPEDAAAREVRLTEILAFDAAGAAPAGDAAAPLLAALDRARGLLIAGGGNLTSTWPAHIYERVALMRLAARRGLPVVVSGQTLGPALGDELRTLIARPLREAALVGVRERDSLLLALNLGVRADRLALTLDDAMFLGADDAPSERGDPFIAVTICRLGEPGREAELLDGLAQQLGAVAVATGARLLLVPHLGSVAGPPAADVEVAQALERRLRDAGATVSSSSLLSPVETAVLTRRAALVVATRYHPLVFGLGGGVPSLGVHLDDYTRTKMQGALAFAGLERWSLHVQVAAGGLLADAALELWERREEVGAHLDALRPRWREASRRHVALVLGALAGEPPAVRPEHVVPPPHAPHPSGRWRAAAYVAERVLNAATAELADLKVHAGQLERNFAEAERYALSLRAALDEAEGRPQPHIAQPLASVPGIVLSDLRHDEVGADAVASMRVRRDGEDLGRLVLRRHGAPPESIDATATPFVAIAALLGTGYARDVRIEGPVDETARLGAEQASRCLGSWFGWRPTIVTACAAAHARAGADGLAMFFSRGLDSMATYVCRHERLEALISMDWRDPPFAGAGTAEIWRGTQEAALETGLPLIAVSTNARTFLDPCLRWEFTHGAVLGSLAQLVSPDVGEALIAGTFPRGREAPFGTHPDLDPLWSSSSLRTTYDDGGGGGRIEKAALIADDPWCIRHLKVCWERDGDGNCGRCCKCLLTMTNFHIAGRLEAAQDRFEAPLAPEAVREVARSGKPTTPTNAALILERLAADDPLREPWERMRERALRDDAATSRGLESRPLSP